MPSNDFLEDDLFDLLEQHEVYIKTLGEKGKRLNLENSNIENFDFSGCNLSHATFTNCNFFSCNFSKTTISDTNFLKCELINVTFFKSNFDRVHFSESIFDQNSNLSECTIFNSKFTDVNTLFTFFINTKFDSVSFSGCNILKSLFNNATFLSCEIEKNNFLCCELPFSSLKSTSLYDTSFAGCELHGIEIENCNFNLCNFGDYYNYNFQSLSKNIKENSYPFNIEYGKISKTTFEKCIGVSKLEQFIQNEKKQEESEARQKTNKNETKNDNLGEQLKLLSILTKLFYTSIVTSIILILFVSTIEQFTTKNQQHLAFICSVTVFLLATSIPPVIYNLHLNILTTLSKSAVANFCDVKSKILSSIYDLTTKKSSGGFITFVLFFLPFCCIAFWVINLKFQNTTLSLVNIGFIIYSFSSAQYFLSRMIMAVKRFLQD